MQEEEFEDTKGIIRISISKKNRQQNGQRNTYKRTNNDLQNIHIKRKIARLRAKVDWYEKGEQSTKYFFNLERKNGQNKFWQKIRSLDGNLKYDIDEILDEQINVYANLFSTEGWDKNVAEELVTHMDKKLTFDESEDLEKDLTINENNFFDETIQITWIRRDYK